MHVLRSTGLLYIFKPSVNLAHVDIFVSIVTYLITGSLARSSCSLVCKCSYIPAGATPAAQGWNSDFFRAIGLEDVVDNGYKQLGGALGQRDSLVLTAGMPVGNGLTKSAAEKLGLIEGTPVGSGVIDA